MSGRVQCNRNFWLWPSAPDAALQGTAAEGYRVTNSAVAGFSERPIKDTPFSVKVVPAELMLNRGANEIDELDKYDASVSNATTTTGWYSTPTIRGLNLHNWSNYRYNGLTISNQQAVGLENKERVEVLKGVAGLQGGFAQPATRTPAITVAMPNATFGFSSGISRRKVRIA